MDKNLTTTDEHQKDSIKDIQKELYFLKKTEKLTSALYKITELMPDNEPLKWRLREEGLELLSCSMSFMDHEKNTSSGEVSSVALCVSRVVSLLELSFMGSFVSQMNFTVLKDEYQGLRDSLHGYRSSKDVQVPLAVAGHEIETAYNSVNRKNPIIKDIYKGQIVEAGNKSDNYNFKVSHLSQKSREPRTRQTIRRSVRSEDKGERKEIILGYIKERRGEVSIKDILESPALSGKCSEKTIQRELVDMVGQGLLKKKGERRWSKYYI